ncbi:type IV pilus modification protein PilV [Undibacterium sp. Di27W]|uniref:type IV pilus modification protein PilV n=1 Tax=Undibacterium sp. Di27W TaxID=3413036 RepID=UPI003BF36777
MINFRKQAGASMIEIIVTIVIVAVGLLGVASLQANTTKFLKIANLRADATQAAYDLGDRMRANGAGVTSQFYVYTTDYATTIATLPTVPTACKGATCTPLLVAQTDLAEWQRGLAKRLYGGAGYVNPVIVGGVTSGYDLIVMWKELNLTTVDPACPTGSPPAPGVGVRCFAIRFTP